MQSALSMLLGAALVAVGVLVSALADRIRGIRADRHAARSAPAKPILTFRDVPARGSDPVMTAPPAAEPAEDPREADIVSAMVGAGYKTKDAQRAARACRDSERVSTESWLAAAFRLAGKQQARQ